METCAAGYLGGLPSHPKRVDDGQLQAGAEGLRFMVTTMENMLPKTHAALSFAHDELRGITIGGGKVKRKGMMAAVALGGVAGAAAHKATRGRQTTPVAVLVEQGGVFATCRFATGAEDAQRVVAALNDARRNSGRVALPLVEGA